MGLVQQRGLRKSYISELVVSIVGKIEDSTEIFSVAENSLFGYKCLTGLIYFPEKNSLFFKIKCIVGNESLFGNFSY